LKWQNIKKILTTLAKQAPCQTEFFAKNPEDMKPLDLLFLPAEVMRFLELAY